MPYHVTGRGNRREPILLAKAIRSSSSACSGPVNPPAHCDREKSANFFGVLDHIAVSQRIRPVRKANPATVKEAAQVMSKCLDATPNSTADRLLGKWDGKTGEHHGSRERSETETEKARRLIASELARVGWSVEQLAREQKGAPVKVAIARRLREEPTMPLKWIALEMRMGTWTHLNRLLHARK